MGRKIPMWQVIVVFLITILLLCYSVNIFGMIYGAATGTDAAETPLSNGYGELHIPLIISAVIAGIFAFANGYKWAFLEKGIIASIGRSMQAILILLIVGMLIGSWINGGVVPAMIYYGLAILNPSIFLVASCLICSIVALATGSSWSTAGTIGVALIGVGMGLGINPAMTAGAIVSGAYFGDKMSPLSDTTNLAPAVSGATLFDHIKHMVWTVTPSLIIALIIYAIMGMGGKTGAADLSAIDAMQTELASLYKINLLLLLPPVLVVVIVALKIPAIPGLLSGVLAGVLAMWYQGIGPSEWFACLHYGVDYFGLIDEGSIQMSEEMADLLSTEGMSGMLWTVNLIICAMCFGGIMDASGMLATLAEALLKVAKNTGTLVTITVFSCLFVNIIASDQYLAVILPGRMYKEAYEDRRLKGKNLSRVLEDSGTITSALVPWNTCGATMSTFLGVPTVQYAPYAFLNWVNPLVSIFYGFTGISMEKMSEEEYQKILAEREAEKADAAKAVEA